MAVANEEEWKKKFIFSVGAQTFPQFVQDEVMNEFIREFSY